MNPRIISFIRFSYAKGDTLIKEFDIIIVHFIDSHIDVPASRIYMAEISEESEGLCINWQFKLHGKISTRKLQKVLKSAVCCILIGLLIIALLMLVLNVDERNIHINVDLNIDVAQLLLFLLKI